jgi:ubiquinone/menaquinone biosynthesis C-methylase UbiE
MDEPQPDHDQLVHQSFAQQQGLFTGDDALFAGRHRALPWLDPLEPDMIVLDVACGAGHVAEQVAPSVRQVVGVDLTPELLELGAARTARAGVANLLLQWGRATALPFVGASFDLVFCRSALHHFDQPAAAVAEMARVCRPGGRVAVADMVAPDDQVRARFDQVHRHLDPSHVAVLSPTELDALLATAVGPTDGIELEPAFRLPLTAIMTDVADRAAVTAALDQELAGGTTTGFQPTRTDDQVQVSFATAIVHATRTR